MRKRILGAVLALTMIVGAAAGLVSHKKVTEGPPICPVEICN